MGQPFTGQTLAKADQDRAALDGCMSNVMKLLATLDAVTQQHHTRMTALLKQAAGGGQATLLNATKQMQEAQMAFNLQYRQIKEQVQTENRKFTVLSNVMKTKQDVTKGTVNNMR